MTRIEVLVPDFRGRLDRALQILEAAPPDVMNHNLETVPRLYRHARPGSDYAHSLKLLAEFKRVVPNVPTKSGVMVGLGETDEEIVQVMHDLRAHHVDMLTVGQYLAPSAHHLPVLRYVHPDTFRAFEAEASRIGFSHAACARWCDRAITPTARPMRPARFNTSRRLARAIGRQLRNDAIDRTIGTRISRGQRDRLHREAIVGRAHAVVIEPRRVVEEHIKFDCQPLAYCESICCSCCWPIHSGWHWLPTVSKNALKPVAL